MVITDRQNWQKRMGLEPGTLVRLSTDSKRYEGLAVVKESNLKGICHEYRVGCSWDSVGKHITEPMNDEKWTRLCASFIEQFSKHKRNFPDYSFHLEIEGKEIV